MAISYIGQVLIKANPRGYILPAFIQSGTSICPDVFPAYMPPGYT